MRNFSRFLASRDVLKQKNLYNIRQAKALLEPTGRKAIARPAVKKESSVFPRDMSDSLPPYVSQDPMTPGLVALERKKMAYLRKKNEVAVGIKGKAAKTAKTSEANREAFQDNFESKGYADNGLEIPGEMSSIAGTLNNLETRQWYLQQEIKIPELINKDLPLKEQARLAFDLRNKFRSQARELMADRELAASLNRTDKNLTWEEVVKKYTEKGFQGDNLYREIVNSSQRSRTNINKSLGLE